MSRFWRLMTVYTSYASRFLIFKITRTFVLSFVLLLLIFLLRAFIDRRKKETGGLRRLYVKLSLWAVLLPVPFLGGLKISYESFHWRNRIYVFLYENMLGYPSAAWFYLGGMLITALWFLFRKVRLRRYVKQFAVCDDPELQVWEEKWAKRIQIRINPLPVTPFTMGIFRHTIVLPAYMLEEFDKEEVEEVLRHEYNHIKSGHLILYAVIGLYQILWFANPLVHLAAIMMKDDLEQICDNLTIRESDYTPHNYGLLLVKSMKYLERERGEKTVSPAFMANRSFRIMKKRIGMIARYEKPEAAFYHRIRGVTIALVLVLFVVGKAVSYPSYTMYEGFSLYSFDGTKAIFQDDPEFDRAVTMTDQGLSINNNKVKEMLDTDENIKRENSYWVFYGGYMKMPGVGGGGDVVLYEPYAMDEDTVMIPYNETDTLADIFGWLFQHI